MLAIGQRRARLCQGLTRREWLRVGGLSSLGLMLPELLRGQAQAGYGGAGSGRYFGRAKSCILCFLFGAPAHQDMWDLKPDAPVETRGEFQPIASSVPGTHLGEHIPRTAARAHRFALVRSVTHPDSTHTVAMHYMMTGVRHRRPQTNPRNEPDDFPCFGAVVQRLRPSGGVLPSGISLNAPGNEVPLGHIFPGFFAGFLGKNYDPMFVIDDPSRPDFNPLPQSQADPGRLAGRRALLEELDGFRRRYAFNEGVANVSQFHEKAFSLVSSPEAGRAFDLSREKPAMRERYGPSPFGQGLLLARRLIESGVRLVTVNWARDYQPNVADHWDTHKNNFNLMKNGLLPAFDLGFSALLDDLEQRGLLDETLVVVMGEFGRTPKINANAGRDHWAGCNSLVLAGAGIHGGLVYGASDRQAAWPAHSPVSPEEIAATIYYALGIPLGSELVDHAGRPHPLSSGKPLLQLFG